MWEKRPLYARRAMAQTRAISRACRSAFAHVVVAMNAGFGTNHSTTPAEEVPADGFDDRRHATASPPAPAPAAWAGTPAANRADTSPPPPVPTWTPEQRAEATSIAAAITAYGPLAGKDLTKLRADLKTACGADAIDALGALARRWDDIASQAQGGVK